MKKDNSCVCLDMSCRSPTCAIRIGDVTMDNDFLRAENSALKAALQAIYEGGVPPGVLATVEERMLAMCRIAGEALKPQAEEK